MTQTLPKRTIRTTSPPQPQTMDGRAFRFDRGQDAASLALRLRTLTTRAHEALHATVSSDDTRRDAELRALHLAIGYLEEDLRSQNLGRLVPYVTALRHQIESNLD
jgi:hypothetical protein